MAVSRFNFNALGARQNVVLGDDRTSHIPPPQPEYKAVAPQPRFNFQALGARQNVVLGDDQPTYEVSSKVPAHHPEPRSRFNFHSVAASDNVSAAVFQEVKHAPSTYVSTYAAAASQAQAGPRNPRFNFGAMGAQTNVVLGDSRPDYRRSSDSEYVAVPKPARFNRDALGARDNVTEVFAPLPPMKPPLPVSNDFSFAQKRAAGL